MVSKLPKIGVSVAVENLSKSLLDLDKLNTAVDKVTNKIKTAAKETSPLNRVFDNLQSQLQKTGQSALSAVPGGEALTGILTGISAAALATVAAVVAVAVAFIALGARGASLIGLAKSFDNLTASVGITSTTLLKDLRRASAGTISDFDLMTRANLALVGSSGEFGKQFGQKLPEILAAARAAARATGQNVDFLFQSLVAGIKRASPRLIDNTGIVLRLGEANEALAAKLGKTVAQLTDEEKQIAVLNATVEAGQALINSLGDSQETSAEKGARAAASLSNILDVVSIAIQPAYAAVLDVVNGVLGGIESFARKAAPFINLVAQGFGLVIQFVGNVIKGIGDALTQEGGLGQQLFEGAYNSFKAFAQGISFAVNKLIFPVIIGVAQFIADFLIGFSPPKSGPLSKIDQGGANLMMAWLDGIAGVSLDPVDKVAAEVAASLGSIGKASMVQVEARLAQLDQALLPFQNRLDIVKSQFDAIAEPAKAALDAIDRQLAEAESALAKGDQGAAERIRLLDAQREAIQGNLDAQQSIVDRSQVQLALAQSQQAQERALLQIRQAQLKITEKAAGVVDKATGKVPKEPKPVGGAAPEPEAVGAGGAGFVLPDSSVLDEFQFEPQQVIDFAVEFAGEENLADFAANQEKLQAQFERIGSVDVGKSLQNKFKGLTDIFDPTNPDSVVGKITGFIATLTGDKEGSIAYFFTNDLPARFEAVKATLSTALESALGGIFNPDIEGSPLNVIRNAVAEFTGLFTTEGSIASLFSQLSTRFEGIKSGLQASIQTTLDSIFNPETEGSPANVIMGIIEGITGEEEGSIAYFFSLLPQRISDAAGGLLDKLKVDIFDPVSNFLTGTDEGTFGGIINGVVTFFTELPARISAALQSLAATLHAGIVVPVVNIFNGMIAVVESGLRSLLNSALDITASVVDALGALAPPELAAAIATLRGSVSNLTIPRIVLPPIEPPAAANGGLFSEGITKVGERGAEYVMSASKMGVLPAALTQVLDSLGSIMAQPAPMLVPGGNTSYQDNHSSSINANFYGQQDSGGVMRRLSLLQARGR